MGVEGCGIIKDIGSNIDKSLLGKKVAFLFEGWANYKTQTVDDLIVLDDEQDLSLAPVACVNPITAMAEIQICKERKSKAVIQIAASSRLVKIFL